MSIARQLEEALGEDFEQKAATHQKQADNALTKVGLTTKDLGPYILSAQEIVKRSKDLAGRYTEKQIAAAIQSYYDHKGKSERMKARAGKSRLGEYGRTERER